MAIEPRAGEKSREAQPMSARWAKVIDHTRCIGCHACSTACKSENQVPLSVHRTYVKYVDIGRFPQSRRVFQVTRCNQCSDPPCATACPTSAMYQRRDGIVDFDKAVCIGCKACIAACPYDAIFINPEDLAAEKCNFCAHRLDIGLEPACVVVCPTEAILVGDLKDSSSRLAQIVEREPVDVRRPEKRTGPHLFYRGAHEATLDPLAAAAPPGGIFLWSEQGRFPRQSAAAPSAPPSASPEAVLSYDIPHQAPWDWRVSLYTWTKGISSGSWLVAAVLVSLGEIPPTGPLWVWFVPSVAALFLVATGALLISDLSHPERFYLIFTRPQWKSWLVRGAFILAVFGAVVGLHAILSLFSFFELSRGLLIPGIPAAFFTAVYTAFLFAQARGRDLWGSPLLPAQIGLQALVAGSCVLLLAALWIEPQIVPALARIAGGASLLHLLIVALEAATHTSAHARVGVLEMTHGRYKKFFWAGQVLMASGLAAPWLPLPAASAALFGLLAYEHAHVQAAQVAPLA